jgi:hypothetical protein
MMPLEELIGCLNPHGSIIDVKSILDPMAVKKRGIRFWRL